MRADRTTLAILMSAGLIGLGGCGAEDAGREVDDAAGKAGKEAEKIGKDAKKEAEKLKDKAKDDSGY